VNVEGGNFAGRGCFGRFAGKPVSVNNEHAPVPAEVYAIPQRQWGS
jgi:hypothetical protein